MDLGCLKSDRFALDIVAFWYSCVFSEFYSSSIPLHLLKPRILISVIHSAISNTNKICIKRVSNACPRTTNITALSTTGNSYVEKPVIFGGMPSSISIFWDEILQESSQNSTKLSFRQ